MHVAFATSDLVHVDAQFVAAPHLAVYDVTARRAVLEHVFVFGPAADGGARYRFADRAAAVAGCAILYVVAAGPSIVARLAASGIRPATATAENRIAALLAHLSALLATDPDPELPSPCEVNA
jgi:nitrogen fixation protein NifX